MMRRPPNYTRTDTLLSFTTLVRSGDERARTALYEAAHSLRVRSRKWSSLRAWGMSIAKRRGMARARVAVARKLAVTLHRMWSDEAEFRFGKEPGADAALAAA